MKILHVSPGFIFYSLLVHFFIAALLISLKESIRDPLRLGFEIPYRRKWFTMGFLTAKIMPKRTKVP
jgi:hypothetical protein